LLNSNEAFGARGKVEIFTEPAYNLAADVQPVAVVLAIENNAPIEAD